MKRTSAGLALYRRKGDACEIFLVHPGGPFWKKKDDGAWSFPKGEYEEGDDALAAARREFAEEVGVEVNGEFIDLGSVEQKGGKIVRVWAVQGDCDASAIRSNTFSMEWPPGSGRQQAFPEVDRAGWFAPEDARRKVIGAQAVFVDRLLGLLAPK